MTIVQALSEMYRMQRITIVFFEVKNCLSYRFLATMQNCNFNFNVFHDRSNISPQTRLVSFLVNLQYTQKLRGIHGSWLTAIWSEVSLPIQRPDINKSIQFYLVVNYSSDDTLCGDKCSLTIFLTSGQCLCFV